MEERRGGCEGVGRAGVCNKEVDAAEGARRSLERGA